MDNYFRKFELIEECFKRLFQIAKDNQTILQYRNSWKDKDAAERNIQKIVEAVIDIGKMLVSQKALREPGSNREVFLVLQENDLFPAELLPVIDKMIGMRNILVHSYDRIDDEIVYGVVSLSCLAKMVFH